MGRVGCRDYESRIVLGLRFIGRIFFIRIVICVIVKRLFVIFCIWVLNVNILFGI